MRLSAIPVGVIACASAWSQPAKPEVDWAKIELQLKQVQAAVAARDMKAVEKASTELWHLSVQEYTTKVAPSPAETLTQLEARGDPRGIYAPYLAMLAAQAGDFVKAESYALTALSKPSDAYDSNHAGNIVLGLVALHRNDLPEAERRLLAAAHTKGSGILDRWGPNLALAKGLLDKGRNEIVLEYFQVCKSFVTKNPKLDDWIASLKGGGKPDLSHEYLWHL